MSDTSTTVELPDAWRELIEGLTIIGQCTGEINATSPLHCEHDKLIICADPEPFDDATIERLEALGFYADEGDGCFYSFRFGSA